MNATATRIRIYEQQEDYKNAFLAFKTYAELKDSMIHADNQEQLNELNKRFEIDELKAFTPLSVSFEKRPAHILSICCSPFVHISKPLNKGCFIRTIITCSFIEIKRAFAF